ncbi:MAG: hypothetical protein GY756_22260, partial [bacterium]|nr:hypothetical protein [bacterium]
MEDDKQDFIDGFVDHVLITLSSKDFEITDSFLQEHFNYSWLNRPWKGFLNPMIQSPYVEIFNGGYFFQYGYQVSLAGSQSDSKEKAKSYYGTNGIEYQKGGLSTVGEDGKVGHPIGGTFFVDYGINARSNKKDSTKIIEEFVGLYTTIPETKKDVLNDYSFYSFSMSNSDSIYVLKDTKGFSICLLILPIETISF